VRAVHAGLPCHVAWALDVLESHPLTVHSHSLEVMACSA
jgi:hypothetical protein